MVCYDVGVRPRTIATLSTLALILASCGRGRTTGAHWPRSAGAITVEDPAEDGGETLDPHLASEAAAVEHGGEDITAILDEPSPTAATTMTPAAAGSAPTTSETAIEGVPVFDEIIIVP